MIEIPQEEELPTREPSEHNGVDDYPSHSGGEQTGGEEEEEKVVDVEGIMRRAGCAGSMEHVLAKPLCPGVQRFVDLISVYEGRVSLMEENVID